MTELVIVVGLTGVGKSSVITGVEKRSENTVQVINHGSKLLETAKSLGLVEHRDQITDIPREEYDTLQAETAKEIANEVRMSTADTVFLDTHATLDTPIGYRPGLTFSDLDHLNPHKFVFITAIPSDIYDRRESDDSRQRDTIPVEKLTEQQGIAQNMVSSMSVHTRAPVSRVVNADGNIDSAINEVVNIIET